MENIKDDDLGMIYLMNKKKEYTTFLFNTEFETVYAMGTDIFLFSNVDKNKTNFRIMNVNYTKCCNEPLGEISVDPNTTTIKFITHYLGESNTLINVRYDNIEKNWDVRSYIDGKEKLTHLKDALQDIEEQDNFGLEIKNNFVEMMNASKEIFNKSMENKLNK